MILLAPIQKKNCRPVLLTDYKLSSGPILEFCGSDPAGRILAISVLKMQKKKKTKQNE